ncbi:MAG: hypothetical protein LBP59_08805 [Planctomycetaceae bacterium]|nr:hypothetical protein [Planctomycetaceae bacterium]
MKIPSLSGRIQFINNIIKKQKNIPLNITFYWASLKIQFFVKKVGGVSPKRRIRYERIIKL